MTNVLRLFADFSVAVLLAVALFAVSRFDQRKGDPRPSTNSSSNVDGGTRRTTEVTELPPEPLRLAVTRPQFDDMGKLLQTLGAGYRFEVIEESALDDPAVRSRFDVVFLTCAKADRSAGTAAEPRTESLRSFVADGGTLYASDLRFDDLAAAFPEFVDATAVAQGTQQDLHAEVDEGGLREILGTEMPLHFDLEGWRPAAFGGGPVTIYLKGKLRTTAGVAIEAPLLVKFPFRSGTVVFTSFHNEKQNSAAEVKLLKHLVFTTVTAKIESKVTRTMISGGFSPQQQNLLNATPDNPSASSAYEHLQVGNLQFVLGFEPRGARLRLEVIGPDGKRYSDQGGSTLTIDVPAAVPGRWRYTIVAEKLPYPNYPFTLTVGAVTTDKLATAKRGADASARSEAADPASASASIPHAVTFKEITLAPGLETQKPAKKWRIAVTPPSFDDMGKLLETLGEGYRYQNLAMDDLRDSEKLAQFDILFLTCHGLPLEWSESDARDTKLDDRPDIFYRPYRREIFEQVCTNLREFVSRGGTLYASDLCYRYFNAAFPEHEDRAGDELLARRLAELDEAEQERLHRLNPAAKIETTREVLQQVRLSKTLDGKVDRIAAAVEVANLAESLSLNRSNLARALKKADLPPIDSDVDAIGRVLALRSIKINRALAKSNTKGALVQVADLRRRIDELRRQLATLNETSGRVQSVRALIVEPGLRELLGESMDLNFNAGDWTPARFAGNDVTVYMRGEYTTSLGAHAEAPLLVKFPVNTGTVIFTAFHNEAQNSKRETELLRYLVFTTVTAREESLVAKTMVSGGFSPAKRSLLSHSSGHPTVTQTYRNQKAGRLRFALSLSNQGASLRFTLVAPGGQKYEKDVQSTLVVDVPEAPVGQWQYTVTALQVPYENFPFSVSVGEEAGTGPP